jgi:hypothetical protein
VRTLAPVGDGFQMHADGLGGQGSQHMSISTGGFRLIFGVGSPPGDRGSLRRASAVNNVFIMTFGSPAAALGKTAQPPRRTPTSEYSLTISSAFPMG